MLNLTGEVVTGRRNIQGRNIKQITGHMIDSASNNHQRIVRLQYNDVLEFPDYGPFNDLWIALQDYEHADWNDMVQLWKFYNLHMIQVIRSVDETKLNNYWIDSHGNNVSLSDMIEGYLSHLELHVGEIRELIG